MSVDAAVRSRLARLRAELAVDIEALATRRDDLAQLRAIQAVEGDSSERTIVEAVHLHAYYTGLETIFERVARLLDEDVPEGGAWHQELLRQMAVDVPGVRPALLPGGSMRDIEELRRFRHFFRNAYALAFDPARVREHSLRVERVHASVADALRGLLDHISAMLGASG